MARVFLLLGFGLVFVAAASASELSDFQDRARAIRAACMEETAATYDFDEMMNKIKAHKFGEDTKFRCYLKCVFEKFGLVNGDNINFDKMLELVPASIHEAGEKIIAACRDTTGADLCEKSFNINKCFQSQGHDKYFVV